MEMEYIVK